MSKYGHFDQVYGETNTFDTKDVKIKPTVKNNGITTMAFQKGQSGNPSGRPQGALNKRAQLAKLLEPHAETLINKVLELALNGDSNALRLCIERLIPKVQHHPIDIDFPAEMNKESEAHLKKSILIAATQGQISISDADKLITLIDKQASSISPEAPYSIDTTDPIEASKIYQAIMTGKY